MRNAIIGGLLFFAELFFPATVMAALTQNDEVASLIKKRLSYMKDIAGYNDLPPGLDTRLS